MTSTLRLLPPLAACALLAGCGEPDTPAITATSVQVMVCCEGSAAAMTLSGTLVPRVESQLAFRVPGRITVRLVDAGEAVAQGQPLARLDDALYTQAVQEAAADVAQAQAALARLARDVERHRALAESGAIARATFDALHTQHAQMQEEVQAAHSRLARARTDLADVILRAPSSGTVALVQADAGQVVAAGTPVLRLAQGGEQEIEVHVPESRIGQIAKDQAARVRLLSLPDVDVNAAVREIASVADAQTRTYRVRLALPEPPAAARLGMTASVQFTTPSPTPTMQLPITALFQQGAEPAVWVLPEGAQHLQLRPVTLSAMGTDRITIASGLTPGERVVIAGVHRLDASMPVKPWDGRLP